MEKVNLGPDGQNKVLGLMMLNNELAAFLIPLVKKTEVSYTWKSRRIFECIRQSYKEVGSCDGVQVARIMDQRGYAEFDCIVDKLFNLVHEANDEP